MPMRRAPYSRADAHRDLNANRLRARQTSVARRRLREPDLVALQELKLLDEQFP
jgi:exonuclease III